MTRKNVVWHEQIKMSKFYMGSVENKEKKKYKLAIKIYLSVQRVPKLSCLGTLILPERVLYVELSL